MENIKTATTREIVEEIKHIVKNRDNLDNVDVLLKELTKRNNNLFNSIGRS